MFFKHKKRKYIVYTRGAEILRRKAEPVADITPAVRTLADELLQVMHLFDGVGLAAPQVGVGQRIVALGVPPGLAANHASPGGALLLPRMPLVVVNPEIVELGSEHGKYDEGCLSIPEIYAPVERPTIIVFRAQTISGEQIECECDGFLSRCIQHEIDHLDGTLFVDRLSLEAFAEIKTKLWQLEKSSSKKDFKRVIRI